MDKKTAFEIASGLNTQTNKVYEPMLWKSYNVEDRIAFLIEECNCTQTQAEDYSYREFASLPPKIRTAIEALEQF